MRTSRPLMGWASTVPSHRVAYDGRAHRSAEWRRLALTLSLLLVVPVAAEAVEQFGALPLGQAAERLRVSDAAVGEDPAGLDRADLRKRQEDVTHSRRPHELGRPGEDLRQFDLPRRELLLQLRSRRPDFVGQPQRTQPLLTRSARSTRICLAGRHAGHFRAASVARIDLLGWKMGLATSARVAVCWKRDTGMIDLPACRETFAKVSGTV